MLWNGAQTFILHVFSSSLYFCLPPSTDLDLLKFHWSLMFCITPLLLWSKTVKEVGLISQISLATLHWKNAWFSVSLCSSHTGHVFPFLLLSSEDYPTQLFPPWAILHQKVLLFGGMLRDQIDEQHFLTSSDITTFVSWFPASIVEKFLWI